jgi:hypothetical protein
MKAKPIPEPDRAADTLPVIRSHDDSITFRHPGPSYLPEAVYNVVEGSFLAETHTGPGLTLDEVLRVYLARCVGFHAARDTEPDPLSPEDTAIYQSQRLEAVIRFQGDQVKVVRVGEAWVTNEAETDGDD